MKKVSTVALIFCPYLCVIEFVYFLVGNFWAEKRCNEKPQIDIPNWDEDYDCDDDHVDDDDDEVM
jgi:hypothetical protein